MWKEQDPDGNVTLHTFNAKGEPDYNITALSDTARGFTSYDDLTSGLSGILGGTDYVSEAVSDVTTDHSTNVRRSRSYIWATGGSSSSSLLSVAESSTDGLQSWQTSYAGPTAQNSHSQTVYGSGGARTATSTAPDGSYAVSTYQNGQLTNVVHKDSSGSTIGNTGYSYDQHGRQSTMTDARNGTTTYTYNAADQVSTVTTPSPGTPGSSAEVTTTYYNGMLQATSVVQPDSTSVYSDFWPTGELKRQHGSRTYPVGYGYDYAGRMQTMTNWTSFSGGSGARVTTWNYDANRGWLTGKVYADGNGPTYDYKPSGRLYHPTQARRTCEEPGTSAAGLTPDCSTSVAPLLKNRSVPARTLWRTGRMAAVDDAGA